MRELLDEPLFLAVASTACFAALWWAFGRARRTLAESRALARRWFLEEGQFKDAIPFDLEMLHKLARRRWAETAVMSSLERIRLAHGGPARAGHLWWIRQQIDGKMPFEQMPPQCIPGHGIGDDVLRGDQPA